MVGGLSLAIGPSVVLAAAGEPSVQSELQEVVVTGIRASLSKSLDLKKDAAVVLDSINATELGRFPDADVADSLQHLPGITITRTTGGEGQQVTVRGLGPQYNIITLNNRILATDDDGRNLAFDVLPSEVISGADVLKSPQASALEGSIGGTVNLRAASPFDNRGVHAGAHAEGNYNSFSKLHGQKFSAFFSDTVADDTVGFLLGLVHSDNKTRTDSLNNNNQNNYGPTTYPFDGTGNAIPLISTPCCIAFGSVFDQKKRDAVSGSVEWRPTSNFKVVADGLYTRLRDPQLGYNQSYYFPLYPPPVTDQNGNPLWTNPTIDHGVVTGVTAHNFQPEVVNNSTYRNVDTKLFGLKATWEVSSQLTLDFDAYHSSADRPEGGLDTYLTAGLVSNTPNAVDTIVFNDQPNSLPSINVLIPPSQLGLSACPGNSGSTTNPGSCSYTALLNSGFLNDNKYWSTHYDVLNGFSVKDQINSGQVSGTLKLDWGSLRQIQFGLVESHRSKSRTDINNNWTNGASEYGSLYTTAGAPVQPNPYSFGSQGFNVLSFQTLPNFMQGAGGSYPGVLPVLDLGTLLSFLKSLDGKPNPAFCSALPCSGAGLLNYAALAPQPDPVNSYHITEKTTSFYLQGDFSGDLWSANVGVRVVHTATTANYSQSVPLSIYTPDQSVTLSPTLYVIPAPVQPASSGASYTLALPSLNASYWLLPHELQLRIGLAETVSRPNLNQLAPNETNQAVGGRPVLTYTGSVGLKPITAYQADLSLEWYYHPRAAVTLAVFDKQVHHDIYTGVTNNVNLGTLEYFGGPPGTAGAPPPKNFLWQIYAPANGSKSNYLGVELTWQHLLENGLGAHFQVTHTKSTGYDQYGTNTGAVNAAPPTTVSIGLIYEKGPISTSINWDYTSSFTSVNSQATEIPNWPVITDSFQWLTASAHYKFGKGFEGYVEGRNLTNAIIRSYLNNNPLLVWANGQNTGQSTSGVGFGYTAFGRSYVAGLAYRF